jgi:hypothetical protein
VAAERPQQQGEAPPQDAWGTWLYTGGHATVCTRAQTVAAVVASMDTCVGEKADDDSDAARELQQTLLNALPGDALYCNARCLAAELDQDTALDAAKTAQAQGRVATELAIAQMRVPFERLLASVECTARVNGRTTAGAHFSACMSGCSSKSAANTYGIRDYDMFAGIVQRTYRCTKYVARLATCCCG